MRKVVFHYHLFKNAGTSVDEMLKASFGASWVTREFQGGPGLVQHQMVDWIRGEPEAVAFSSHTALLPPPRGAGLQVFPIIFVRHPIDRIASAYAFERRQGGDGLGAVLARRTDLAGYVEVRLAMGYDRQCRNFHCARLAQMFKPETGGEPERALRAIEELPFVGLVESYDESIARLGKWLQPHFPQLKPVVVARNVGRNLADPLEARLAEARAAIGETLWAQLMEINAPDLAVYETVRARFAEG